jgi:hypothetical protein
VTATSPVWAGTESVTGTATLCGYGRLAWPDVVAALEGVDVAWADYDGFHVGALPQAPPPYNHLWAWNDDWLVRARVDGAHAIVGELQVNTVPVPDSALRAMRQPRLIETVRYTCRESRTWTPGERRVGPLDPAVKGRLVDLYQVDGARPVTFVRAREPWYGAA